MKCSNPECNHDIGLLAHRRGWFGRRRYCSRRCRDAFAGDRPKQSQQERTEATYFEWLFLQPVEKPRPKLTPAVVRVRAR